MSQQFSFEDFIESMKTRDYADVLGATQSALAAAEAVSYQVRGARANRAAGIVDYVRRLKAFLFFLQSGTIPGGSDRYEWSLYRKVAERLFEKGQLEKKVLDALNPPKQQL
jgi:hypothetical protein